MSNKAELPEDAQNQMSQIEAVYKDGVMTIDGKDFVFTKLKHKQRRKVFAFMTRIQYMLKNGDFSFLDWVDFEPVEKIIEDSITVDDLQISKHKDYWDSEDNAGRYLKFISMAMPVIAYPLMSGGSGV